MTYLRDHFFTIIIGVAVVLNAALAYYRFVLKEQYQVSYEGSCDPVMHECFVGCGDDDCSETYFYAKIETYAPDLFAKCGEDITGCEAADACLPTDRNCSITYCGQDAAPGECDAVTAQDRPEVSEEPEDADL